MFRVEVAAQHRRAEFVGDLVRQAREAALTPEQVASPLARRPYDLRHACASTWLAAGVDVTEIAERLGHSVEMLLKVYVACIDGTVETNNARISAALDGALSGTQTNVLALWDTQLTRRNKPAETGAEGSIAA